VQVEELPSYDSREQILERKEVAFQATQFDLTSHGKLSPRTDDKQQPSSSKNRLGKSRLLLLHDLDLN
jgi:hypothetical protein